MADRLVDLLRASSINVFFSPRNIRGGHEWNKEIGVALDRCDWFVLLLTPASVESMWVDRELQYALMEQRYRDRIVPCLVSPCDYRKLSWSLKLFEIIDFADFDVGSGKLLELWGVSRPQLPRASTQQ